MSKELTMVQKKEWAQMLYLANQLLQKEIAAKVGTTEKTISAWAIKGNWEKLRKSLLTSKSELLTFCYDVLSKLKEKILSEDGIGDTKDADKFIKYTASIKSLETETSIAELMEAGKLFHKFLQRVSESDIAYPLKVVNDFDAFIREKMKGV